MQNTLKYFRPRWVHIRYYHTLIISFPTECQGVNNYYPFAMIIAVMSRKMRKTVAGMRQRISEGTRIITKVANRRVSGCKLQSLNVRIVPDVSSWKHEFPLYRPQPYFCDDISLRDNAGWLWAPCEPSVMLGPFRAECKLQRVDEAPTGCLYLTII